MRRILLGISTILLASCGAEKTEARNANAVGGQADPMQMAQINPQGAGMAPFPGQVNGRAIPGQGAGQPLPPGVFAMQKAQLVDNGGFDRPLVAATLLIPAGWRLEGGVQWNTTGACGPDYTTIASIISPDGGSQMRTFPVARWNAVQSVAPIDQSQQQQSNCENANYRTVRQFLEATAMRLFPGARILDYRELAEEARPMRELIEQAPPPPSLPGDPSRLDIRYEGGELLIAYQENGREMRAAVSTLAMIMEMQIMSMLTPGQVDFASVQGFPGSITVVSAPAGSLDLGLRQRVARSLRFQPEWMENINKYEAKKAGVMRKGAEDRHAIIMDGIKKRGEIINGMYRDRDLASDRMQRESIEAIRGVETYDDPVLGSPVQLDNTYEYAYRVNNSDSYILTNDANFNPGVYGIDAQQMTPTQ